MANCGTRRVSQCLACLREFAGFSRIWNARNAPLPGTAPWRARAAEPAARHFVRSSSRKLATWRPGAVLLSSTRKSLPRPPAGGGAWALGGGRVGGQAPGSQARLYFAPGAFSPTVSRNTRSSRVRRPCRRRPVSSGGGCAGGRRFLGRALLLYLGLPRACRELRETTFCQQSPAGWLGCVFCQLTGSFADGCQLAGSRIS